MDIHNINRNMCVDIVPYLDYKCLQLKLNECIDFDHNYECNTIACHKSKEVSEFMILSDFL